MASRTPSIVSPASLAPTRRRVLRTGVAAGAGALVALAAPGLVRAQARPRLRIGYWPVAAGLPFFAAVEKGYFKEAGLDVEPLKFAGAQQVMEAMLAGRSDAVGALGLGREFLQRSGQRIGAGIGRQEPARDPVYQTVGNAFVRDDRPARVQIVEQLDREASGTPAREHQGGGLEREAARGGEIAFDDSQ